jgi:hypothetical protein
LQGESLLRDEEFYLQEIAIATSIAFPFLTAASAPAE